jgi:putative phage-type endonuclease
MPELIDVRPGTPEWHDARRQGVTATDLPAILGISPYDSAYSLYYRKRGELPELEDNDRFRLGRDLEPIIAQRWLDEDPKRWMLGPGLWRSTERPWQMATLDRLAGSDLAGPDEVLELKSWADADRHAWDDTPPPAVRAQLLWQMDTMGVSRGHVGVLFLPSGEFRSYTIEHDESPVREYPHDVPGPLASAICEACGDIELMRDKARDFIGNLDLGQPPSLDGSVMTLAAVRARLIPAPGKKAVVDIRLTAQLAAHRREAKDAETYARRIEAEIREQAGEATVYTDEDGKVIGRRVIADAPVKAHTRHSDYIRITNTKGTDDDQ